ncbi:ParB/RepB/Spo0J family partition protein [Streptacidiphilus fuscans]|uniref:ParB N-terminal domain-containing protein n=1 Tax=Streptacidiphilus fuscans TaxID=2789292 RepID=A0A931B625_9ACTN|nr:ParB N-terminal domain-containing protein [Streptacidiphilus fuscans]MBF9071774.1 ParB N-terminal domain-containing protein [Streptacidiphilus fuscans]
MIEFHPATADVPLMDDAALEALVRSIQAVGLLHPIVRDRRGLVLDGRSRLRACEIAGIKPQFTTYDGDDCAAYVRAVNRQRRGLSKGQQAVIAVKSAALSGLPRRTNSEISVATGVSRSHISKAATVWRHDTVLADRVIDGRISLTDAYDVARQQPTTWPGPEPRPLRLAPRAAGQPVPGHRVATAAGVVRALSHTGDRSAPTQRRRLNSAARTLLRRWL